MYNTYEFKRSFYGRAKLEVDFNVENHLKLGCTKLCLDTESLETKKLTQVDKFCVRNCAMKAYDMKMAFLNFRESQLATEKREEKANIHI